MKSFHLTLIIIFYSIVVMAQSENDNYFTQIYPSPLGNKVIIVECDRYREMPCYYSVISTKLYDVPIDCDKYILLNKLYRIQWDSQGAKIYNTRTIEGFTRGTFAIEVYDTLGSNFDTIMHAFSPISSYGKLYFCREYDVTSKRYYPQIFKYDLETKKETLLHRFDSIYTFWPEQIDCIQYPEFKFNSTYPLEIVCVLYSKDNYKAQHTAVVDCGGKGILLWREGYHFNCMTNE